MERDVTSSPPMSLAYEDAAPALPRDDTDEVRCPPDGVARLRRIKINLVSGFELRLLIHHNGSQIFSTDGLCRLGCKHVLSWSPCRYAGHAGS